MYTAVSGNYLIFCTLSQYVLCLVCHPTTHLCIHSSPVWLYHAKWSTIFSQLFTPLVPYGDQKRWKYLFLPIAPFAGIYGHLYKKGHHLQRVVVILDHVIFANRLTKTNVWLKHTRLISLPTAIIVSWITVWGRLSVTIKTLWTTLLESRFWLSVAFKIFSVQEIGKNLHTLVNLRHNTWSMVLNDTAFGMGRGWG